MIRCIGTNCCSSSLDFIFNCICVSTTGQQRQQQQQQPLYLLVPPAIIEYSHRFMMELKDPHVMVELGPGHCILFMEQPVSEYVYQQFYQLLVIDFRLLLLPR